MTTVELAYRQMITESNDIDFDGDIEISDIVDILDDLDPDELGEVMDIITDYLEYIDDDDYEYDMDERVVKKKVIRNGKKVIIKKSDKAGYKIDNGKEVKMKSGEIRKRAKSAKKASKKRKANKASIQRKRKKSIKLRKSSSI